MLVVTGHARRQRQPIQWLSHQCAGHEHHAFQARKTSEHVNRFCQGGRVRVHTVTAAPRYQIDAARRAWLMQHCDSINVFQLKCQLPGMQMVMTKQQNKLVKEWQLMQAYMQAMQTACPCSSKHSCVKAATPQGLGFRA